MNYLQNLKPSEHLTEWLEAFNNNGYWSARASNQNVQTNMPQRRMTGAIEKSINRSKILNQEEGNNKKKSTKRPRN